MNVKLIEINENQKHDYNRFVMENESGSFLQSWEWGEWQVRQGRTVYRFKVADESGNWVGSLQLIQMPLPMGKFYLYCPYGPVAGENFQFSIFNFQTIFNEIISKFPKAVFIRIEPKQLISLPADQLINLEKTANIQPSKTLIIDLKKSEEQLLAEMHHKTRYNIKLAQRHGVEIKDEFQISIGNGLYYKEAVELIIETANRQSFNTYSPKYYHQLIDALAINGKGDLKLHIYKAIYQNQLLASAVMVDFGKTRTFLFGGSSDKYKNVMAPYLLHFKAMTDAKAAGFAAYDFWGIETSSGETPGFVRFKLGFGGLTVEYPGAYDLIQNKPFYTLYKVVRKMNRLRRR